MNIAQQYYGAEIHDVQVEVYLEITPNKVGVQPPNQPAVTRYSLFVFNQKILADTYIVKSNQQINNRIPLSAPQVVLNYTPIITTRGKGGSEVSNPYALIRGLYPDYDFTDEDNYDPKNLIKVQSIKSISTSPTGNLIEVTATYSLICSAPPKVIIGRQKPE